MSYEIITTPNFQKEFKKLAKRYPSIQDDIIQLAKSLAQNPTQGSEIFKNCFKIRLLIKSKGRGKSGGGRLITYVMFSNKKIYLLTIYDKSDKETVGDKYLRQLLKDLE